MRKFLMIALVMISTLCEGQSGWLNYSGAKNYAMWTTKWLQADNVFYWKGDTIKKEFLGYFDLRSDSLRMKYIGGSWSPWYYAGRGAYILPVASASTLGGIKVGSGLSITNGVLSSTGGDLSGYVPYTGAAGDIILGAHGLSTTLGIITPKIYPASNTTTAFQINKADATTNILNVDATNGRIGINTITPNALLNIFATGNSSDVLLHVGANSGYYFRVVSGSAPRTEIVANGSVNALTVRNTSTVSTADLIKLGLSNLTAAHITTYNANEDFRIQPNGAGNVLLNSRGFGNTGIGLTSSPTARLHLSSGTAASGTAPLKFSSGVVLTTPEPGAVEFDGVDLFFTSSIRQKFIFNNDSRLTDSRAASDVYSWAKALTKPEYTWTEITSKPTFATVATSGDYNDLVNKPAIGTTTATQIINSSTSTTIDYTAGSNALLTMIGNITTLTFTNVPDGGYGDIYVIQNSTGGYGISNIVHSGLTSSYPDPDGDNVGNKPVASNINSLATRKTTISYHRLGSYLLITYGNYAQ